jgi:Reverse transcriptase (RNA-dependent DNA polymerase)
VPVAGKLVGQRVGAAPAAVGQPSRLLYLIDAASGRRFLVDSGAAFSVLPFRSTSSPTGLPLRGADDEKIDCWGTCRRAVYAGGRRFNMLFLKAAVAFPILGADFLHQFDLILRVRKQLLYSAGGWSVSLTPFVSATTSFSVVIPVGLFSQESAADTVPPAASLCAGLTVDSLAREFPSVFSSTSVLPEARHGIEHQILTTGRPVTARYRRLDAAKYKAARDEFLQMEKAGIVRRSTSCWASPLHMVKKPDGTWRPCGDYRRLNVQTVPDRYTCPNMADLSARLAGTRVFSKLDLKKGYFQVPVHPDDICKTALITPFGTFEFLRMPFGLRNAGQTFQRLMDQIMRGLDYCFVYLDDILIASES